MYGPPLGLIGMPRDETERYLRAIVAGKSEEDAMEAALGVTRAAQPPDPTRQLPRAGDQNLFERSMLPPRSGCKWSWGGWRGGVRLR